MKRFIEILAVALLFILPACTTIAAEQGAPVGEKLYALQIPGVGAVQPGLNYVTPAGSSNCGSGDYYYITYFCSCGGSCKVDKEYMCHNNCKCYDTYDEMPSECTSYSVGTKE